MLGQVRLFDKGVRPHLAQQFILFQQAPTVLHQKDQSVERLRRQPNWRLAPQKQTFRGIQAEWAKLENGLCFEGHKSIQKSFRKTLSRPEDY